MKFSKKRYGVLTVLILTAALPAAAFGAEPAAVGTSAEILNVEDMTASGYNTIASWGSRTGHGDIYIGYDIADGILNPQTSNSTTEDISLIEFNSRVEGAGYTAVYASGEQTDVCLTGSLELYDDTDGFSGSDFTGQGVAVVAANNSTVVLDQMNIVTDGFMRNAVIADSGADVYVLDSTLITYGADPLTEGYSSYGISAEQAIMISPPWVLGLQGGVRNINILGKYANLTVVDSVLVSGGWALLSTDACTSPYMVVIDSDLSFVTETEGGEESGWQIFGYEEGEYGSGYGSYCIGQPNEMFYGVHISGATYASILKGGYVRYGSSEGMIPVYDAYDYTVNGTQTLLNEFEGSGRISEIHTVFGFMAHNEGTLDITDGTIVDSEECTFLYRNGSGTTFIADNAVLNPGNGVILQMIDDDDSTVGNCDDGSNFFANYLFEDPGLPSESGNVFAEEGGSMVYLELKNGEYSGNAYNGTGYYSYYANNPGRSGTFTNAADFLTVTMDNASLDGDVSLTQTIHGIKIDDRNGDDVCNSDDLDLIITAIEEVNAAVDAMDISLDYIRNAFAENNDIQYVLLDENFAVTEDKEQAVYIQFTQFTVAQHYMLGHFLNSPYYNGVSAINVYVENGSSWKVAGESIISYLKIDETSEVYAALTDNGDGTITLTASDTALSAGEYGEEYIYVEPVREQRGDSGSGQGESGEGASEGESAGGPEG